MMMVVVQAQIGERQKTDRGSSTVSLTIPDVVMGDMTENDLLQYCMIIGIELGVMILLCCVHRSRYLNDISLERIERELERQDRRHDE